MLPDFPVQPEEPDPADEAIDAAVYETHPALEYEYPYLAQDAESALIAAEGQNPLVRGIERVGEWSGSLFGRFTRPPDFAVPKRFGLSAILGITTALAILFAGLKWGDAWPVFYLFFGGQAIVICLVQMFVGNAPRTASVVAGAAILPLFTILAIGFTHRGPPLEGLGCMLLLFIPLGALFGYITGTCAAGIFLIMDYLEPYLQGRPSRGSQGPTAGASS